MSQYMLALVEHDDRVATIGGTLVAWQFERGRPDGEAAAGASGRPGDPNFRAVSDALRSIPPCPDGALIHEWFMSLAGFRHGPVVLAGPFEWDAEPREVLHWTLSQSGLTARTVALIRSGVTEPYGRT